MNQENLLILIDNEVVSEKSTNRRIAREYKKLLKISYQDLTTKTLNYKRCS